MSIINIIFGNHPERVTIEVSTPSVVELDDAVHRINERMKEPSGVISATVSNLHDYINANYRASFTYPPEPQPASYVDTINAICDRGNDDMMSLCNEIIQEIEVLRNTKWDTSYFCGQTVTSQLNQLAWCEELLQMYMDCFHYSVLLRLQGPGDSLTYPPLAGTCLDCTIPENGYAGIC